MTDTATMPAGPELDRLVAEKVMGWRMAPHRQGMFMYQCWCLDGKPLRTIHAFAPSTRGAHSLEVVERMRSLGWGYTISASPTGLRYCEFDRDGGEDEDRHVCADAEDADQYVAICRAALAAVGAG